MRKALGALGSALLCVAGSGCGNDSATDAQPASAPDAASMETPSEAPCPVMVNDKDCDKSKRPIVFIHGSPGTGDYFDHPALLFASNGLCSDRIRAIDYNSINRADLEGVYLDVETETTQLIDQLREDTGAEKVDLVAHSEGSVHASRYAAAHPDKIAHYVHLAGGQLGANPGGVPTLCLSSTGDRPVKCATTKNTILADDALDHFAICSSAASFKEMYRFLSGDAEPEYDQVQCGEPLLIEGKAVTSGDNDRMSGAKIEVYELAGEPRERATPVATLNVREDGSVGPWTAKHGVHYEFKQLPKSGDERAARFAYYQPFKRSDRLLRFVYESRDPTAMSAASMANLTDDTAAVVVRHKQGAFLNGRDHLLVQGFEAINEQDAMPKATVVSLYVLDQDGDRESDGGSVLRATFVNGTDIYLPTESPAFIELDFNGAQLRVPNWPSKTGGLSMVWFD